MMAVVVTESAMLQQVKEEVLATYAAFLAAFQADDLAALNALIQFPFAYIGQGGTVLLDTFPIQPAALRAAKQWHDTKDFSYEVVFASDDKAHLIVRQATRIRADGSPIESVSAFYALTRTPSGWKFFALSDITIPAP
jgi:hypothetical protein